MFTTGRLIFIGFFLIVFTGVMIWSYSKEKKLNRIHFKKSYLILIAIILFLMLQFVIVKIGGFI
jgi:hypothetical protein